MSFIWQVFNHSADKSGNGKSKRWYSKIIKAVAVFAR